MTILSAATLLFLVMDPFGNIPIFLSILEPYSSARRLRIILREMLIALAVLLLFLFAGQYILDALGISESSLTAAGGVILFLIALRMIFPRAGGGGMVEHSSEDEPLVVPLAIPLIAGPSALASVMFIMSSDPSRAGVWAEARVDRDSAAHGDDLDRHRHQYDDDGHSRLLRALSCSSPAQMDVAVRF